MKKILSILSAGLVALSALVSCVHEQFAVFDASKATAPVLQSYTVTDDNVTIDFTPGVLGQDFNKNVQLNHFILLKSVNGQATETVVPSTVKDNQIIVTVANLSKTLIGLGYEEGQTVSLEMVIRATLQDVARDNRRNGYVESAGTINIAEYEIFLPSGDPYARYTEKSEWGLVGSFNDWGGSPDVEMWTNGTLHVAKAVELEAGAEVKFRKDASWDVNFGYAEGVSAYTLGEEFALGQGGANIVIAEAGKYDLILDVDGATAKIIKSVAQQEDPYAAYTETSPWSVIGSFNSWGGDVEMVTNGTLHVCKNITLAAGDEFKFRKDGGWDVNFGYAEGVESYTLGAEFAVGQGGANIIIAEDGAYDLFLDPENATAKIIKTQAVTIDPYASYTEVSPWSVIGSFNSWGDDEEMVTDGTLHVCKAIALNAGDEWKFRKDADWAVNFGYAEGVDSYTLGEEFAVGQDGANIIVLEDGVYDFILDPENATAKVIKSVAADAGEVPQPKPKPKAWSVIGTLEDSGWGQDYDLTNVSGDVWTIKNLHVRAQDEFKIRADHDWGKSYGGPEENAESTYEEGNVYGVYQPVLGQTFNAGDKNIRIGVEGNYNITLTYGDESTILIEEYKEFPDALYMTGTDFGGWDWNSDGVVEFIPVLHNPGWGAEAEAQFWAVRYLTAGNGVKFNSTRAWDGGQFGALETNEGFTNDNDGNLVVSESGLYMIHVDFKRSILHVEPARIYAVGATVGDGSWTEGLEEGLFTNAGAKTSFTAQRGGELRMYAASEIATSACWTREFIILDGKIVYRGTGGDQERVNVLGGQVVTLDFNAGTGTITGEGQAPAYKTEISVPGAYSGSEWNLDTAPKLQGNADGVFKGALSMYKKDGADIEFKFGHDGNWIGGTPEGESYTLGAGDNMTIDEGTYFWTVDLESKTAVALKVDKVGLIGSFNSWSDDVVLTFDAADCTYNGSVTLEDNAELKVRFNGNWDYCLGGELTQLSAIAGNAKVAKGGDYTAKLDLNKGTLTLTPKGGQPAGGITIDGDMSDWADIEGAETPDNLCKVMKVFNDDTNFYVYLASAPGGRGKDLWGNEAGYYYLDFDWDNNEETGIAEGSNPGFDCWCYLYIFGGTAESSFIKEHPNGSGKEMSIKNITAKGVITDDLIEIELSIPRADMVDVDAGTQARVLSWRSKDGTKITQIYTVK